MRVLLDGEVIAVAARDERYEYKLFQRACHRNDATTVLRLDTFVTAQMGRPPALSPAVMDRQGKIVDEKVRRGQNVIHTPQVRRGAIQISGYDSAQVPGSFEALLTEIAHEAIREVNPDAPISAFKSYSAHTIAKAADQLNLGKVTMKQGQNVRRNEANSDVYNFISLAAMMLVLFNQITGIPVSELRTMTEFEVALDERFLDSFDPRLLFNIDKSSTFLGDFEEETGIISSDMQEELSEHSRSAKHTKPGTEDQRRSIGYTAVTSSSGDVDLFITHLTDHTLSGTEAIPRPAQLHQLVGYPRYWVLTNGTSFASTDTEEANLVFRLALKTIAEKRERIAREDEAALVFDMATFSDAALSPAG
ncbi:hypothetical protein B484DRAFT_437556, partial [Ochromonadaceae sp. CCMP2298]